MTSVNSATGRSGLPANVAVILPGTGSDEVFVRAVFEEPLSSFGVRLIAPAPRPGSGLADAYLAALDAAAAESDQPILAGGVSFGAHLSSAWALRNQVRCAGLMAALPAWNGVPDVAPASIAARVSADLVRSQGLERALAVATADVAPWLADELRRAWRRQGTSLADGLDAASRYPAPELTALRTLDVPTGISACTDDLVHPAEVAYAWADAIPRARVQDTTLAALGADRACLGRATVLALLTALSRA
ncbi:MAG: alpha/beta fold hydrolase [Haloechinothrix sp.]